MTVCFMCVFDSLCVVYAPITKCRVRARFVPTLVLKSMLLERRKWSTAYRVRRQALVSESYIAAYTVTFGA